jgi:hypothetical protein
LFLHLYALRLEASYAYSIYPTSRARVTQTSTQHSVITITLHKVVDGNYHSDPISAAEFDRASP